MGLFEEEAVADVEEAAVSEEAEVKEEAQDEEEIEESEAVEDEEQVEEEETIYEIDGEEVSAETLEAWKSAHSREQENETANGEITKLKDELTSKAQKLDESLAVFEAAESELESLLLSDLETVDMKDLKENDYQEYLRTKELIDERKAQITSLKEKFSSVRAAKLSEESDKLGSLRGWSTEEKRNAELTVLNDYAKAAQYTADDMKTLTSAKVISDLLDYAKLKSSVGSKKQNRKKVVKTTSVKTKQKSDDKPTTLEDRLFS